MAYTVFELLTREVQGDQEVPEKTCMKLEVGCRVMFRICLFLTQCLAQGSQVGFGELLQTYQEN